jgi:hypothetical protein
MGHCRESRKPVAHRRFTACLALWPAGSGAGKITVVRSGIGGAVGSDQQDRTGSVMNALIWIVLVIAVIFFILGGTVKAVSFLLWVAPILLVIAIVVFLMNRSRGRRGI